MCKEKVNEKHYVQCNSWVPSGQEKSRRASGLGALKTLWEKGYQPAGAKLFLLTENLLHYAS